MTDTFDRLKVALGDSYAIERELGSGGMATVYLAEDLKHHRQVAVKVLRSDLAAALGPERFIREIEVAAQLHHPHILPLYDSGEVDGFLYYVMPYEEGQSLREKLEKEGELPVTEAVRLLRDVVDALAHAHKRGVVHRDIKPDNVMLSDRHALVTDFGVAKAVSEATGRQQLTTAGVALGTPAYMAPEQAVADPHIDHRADIYAVGALAYELLTGRPPFTGTTAQEVLSAHVTEAPDVVTKHRATVPDALAQVVMRCLEKKPADRWQSAEELLPQLEALATPSVGVTPTDMLPVGAPPAWGRRWSPKTRIAVSAGAVLAVAAGAFALFRPEPGAALVPNRVVVAVLENQTGDPSLDPVGRMAADWITQGLQKTGIVDVIPSPTAIQASQFVQTEIQSGRGRDPVRALAEETGAGTVISGAYYQEGEALQFQVQVTDAHAGQLLEALDPVSGTPESPREAIERLRQRVMGFLAVWLDERLASQATIAGEPPTYESYKAFNEGMELYLLRSDWANAIPPFYRAFELDTTFVVPLLYAAINHINVGSFANPGAWVLADSVLEEIGERRDRLTDYDRMWLEYAQATVAGDLERALTAIRRAAEMAPGSKAVYNVAWTAYRLNRPREAIDALERLDPERGPMRGWVHYWDHLRWSYHLLGDYAKELEVARREREQYPDRIWSAFGLATALAAAGRVQELEAALNQLTASTAEGTFSPGYGMIIAARELRAHNQSEAAARDVFERAVQWYERQPTPNRFFLANALYGAEQWDRAANTYRALADEFPDVARYRALLGIVAARQGDATEARRVSEWLASLNRPYAFGQLTWYRARITALLGERDEAVALMRAAYGEGKRYVPGDHVEIDFESLRDYPPFQELIRPKG